MKNCRQSAVSLSALLLILVAAPAFSGPNLGDPGSWSVTWENDLFSPKSTDRHYTNGLQATKTSQNYTQFTQDNTYQWLIDFSTLFPVGKLNWEQRRTTVSFGQIMQTPEDVTTEIPDDTDTPYGGVLYLAHGLEGYSQRYADHLDLMIGVTGKYSLAEQSQNLVHTITGSEPPQGWDSQIPSTLLVNLYYSRRGYMPLASEASRWQIDALGYGHIALGNAQTDAMLGAGFAIHEQSISALGIRPGRLARDVVFTGDKTTQGWFMYGGVSAKAVVHDVLLDGVIIKDSPSVDKKPLVGQFITSLGYKWSAMAFHFSWVLSSPTFENERGGYDHYGSLNFSWRT